MFSEMFEMFGGAERQEASDANDSAGVVHVDGGGAGDFGESGHEHHVAGDDHDEAGTGRKRGVGDVERPAGRRTEALGIIG